MIFKKSQEDSQTSIRPLHQNVRVGESVEIQQELMIANKDDSSLEEIFTYLMQQYRYQQYLRTNITAQSSTRPQREF